MKLKQLLSEDKGRGVLRVFKEGATGVCKKIFVTFVYIEKKLYFCAPIL